MADVVVAGAMAQRPGRAGHAWVFVNWLAGFRALGLDVAFVDRMTPELGDVERGVRWVADTMARVGLADGWSVLLADGCCAGGSRATVAARLRGAVLLNVMGYLDDPELLALPARRVLLDLDPGFGQAWQAAGQATLFTGHDRYATVGLNVGRPGCGVPDLGLDWVPTLPPVDLAAWATTSPPAGCFTTVATWRGPFAPIEIGGRTYGLRAHAARALAALPARTGQPLEMALDIDAADERDRQLLLDGGWRLVAPGCVAAGLDGYRRYVHGSLAELAVAKETYTALRTGWVSDRSACYLAAGRAVVTSDTGLADHLPAGCGLLTYRTPDEAAAAVEEVAGDPARHGAAARELAAEHFDAATVAAALLQRTA